MIWLSHPQFSPSQHSSWPLTLFSLHIEQPSVFTSTPLVLSKPLCLQFLQPPSFPLLGKFLLGPPRGLSWDVSFSSKPPWVKVGDTLPCVMVPPHHDNYFVTDSQCHPWFFSSLIHSLWREAMIRFSLIFLVGDPLPSWQSPLYKVWGDYCGRKNAELVANSVSDPIHPFIYSFNQ